MSKLVTLLLLSTLLLAACYNRKKDELYAPPAGSTCDTSNVTYSTMVSATMNQSCALSGCHNTASNANGVVLDTYAGVKNALSGGRLLGAIRHETGYIPMPQAAAKLDDCTISKIAAWVNAGALNN